MKIMPFSNGSQATDWELSNCDKCQKEAGPNGRCPLKCDIQDALTIAYCTDGYIDKEIAKRMGCDESSKYVWMCPEREVK